MTEHKARRLKLGDRIEVFHRGSRRPAQPGCVTGFGTNDEGEFNIRVRLDGLHGNGLTRSGRVRQADWYHYVHLRLPTVLDPLPANVYADFLEEHGFPDAAVALREAFPLVPASEIPTRPA